MENVTKAPQLIEKEEVAHLKFLDVEVLHLEEAIKSRRIDLERATTLGNLEYSKIKIIFEDSEGLKQVETTIWATTDKRVILKHGIVIPIQRIHAVKMF